MYIFLGHLGSSDQNRSQILNLRDQLNEKMIDLSKKIQWWSMVSLWREGGGHGREFFSWCGDYLWWFVEYVTFLWNVSTLLSLFSIDHRKYIILAGEFYCTEHPDMQKIFSTKTNRALVAIVVQSQLTSFCHFYFFIYQTIFLKFCFIFRIR